MGKFLNKTLALVLALVMVVSGAALAFADDTAADTSADIEKSMLMTLEELDAYEMPQTPADKPAVMLNGEYVAFNDAKPCNISGRVMVPFRAILEAMGADVNYDSATKEISAALGDKTIYFHAGNSELKIVENGNESKITMDVIPFIDAYTQRTYVSTRFVAEAFGLSTGWDSAEKTVIIIDYDRMIPEIAAKFTIFGMLFDNRDVDWEKNYKTEGNVNIVAKLAKELMQSMTGDENAKAANIKLDMDIDAIQKGMNADMTIGIDADIKAIYDIFGIDVYEQAYVEKLLEDLDIAIKLDDENIYISMGLLDYLFSGEDEKPANGQTTWYAIPLTLVYETYEEMGMDFESMMKSATELKTFEDYLKLFAAMDEDYMNIHTYEKVCAAVAVIEELIGDDEFVKSGNTYTLTINPKQLAKKLDKLGNKTADEYIYELYSAGINFDAVIKIKTTSAGKVSNYNISGMMDLEGLIHEDNSKMTVKISGNAYTADIDFVIDIPEVVNLTIGIDSNMTATNKMPDLKIPAGDKIVDFSNFMI